MQDITEREKRTYWLGKGDLWLKVAPIVATFHFLDSWDCWNCTRRRFETYLSLIISIIEGGHNIWFSFELNSSWRNTFHKHEALIDSPTGGSACHHNIRHARTAWSWTWMSVSGNMLASAFQIVIRNALAIIPTSLSLAKVVHLVALSPQLKSWNSIPMIVVVS